MIKKITIIISLILLVVLSTNAQPSNQAIQYDIKYNIKELGDINNDEKITVADALIYLRYANGQDISPFQMSENDDVTCDGRITIKDALMILSYATGKPVVLGCRK